MRETQPSVFLISRPAVEWGAVRRYLEEIGGEGWIDRQESQALSSSESLVEFAGRLCYRSWEPGLNPNVRRIRTDAAEYFDNILSSGHGSVLEHSQFSFV